MLINKEYEALFNEIGVEDRESQEIALEFIYNLARLGIECVNNKKKSMADYGEQE